MRHSCVVAVLQLALAGTVCAAAGMPPHLSPDGQSEYRAFLEAPGHRAFAVAPGGAFGWVAGEADAGSAEDKALAACQSQGAQRCVAYAIDGRTVFDARAWPRLWGPYATSAQAVRAATGTELGRRFPDLAFADAHGNPTSIASLRGKVALVHFWGAWCPPCRREMPDLQRLQAALASRRDIVFVPLQSRERFEVSRAWASRQGIGLPLFDSGATGEDDAKLRLVGGNAIADREIAARFPTTYVLDKHGLVVFSHVGPVTDWLQYEPFLRDAAERSGGR